MRSDLEFFTLKHRIFLVKNYYQYMGDYLCVKTKYEDQYKDSIECPTFSYDVLMEIVNLFERSGSVFKSQEVASEGSNRPIERVYVKEEEEFNADDEQDSLKLPTNRGKKKKAEHDEMFWEPPNFSDDDDAEEQNKVQSLESQMFSETSETDYLAKQQNRGGKPPRLRPFSKEALEKELSSNPAFSFAQNSSSLLEMSLPGAAGTVMLHPSYDRKLNEITRKLDQLLKGQKPVGDTRGFVIAPPDEIVNLNINFPISTKEEFDMINSHLANDDYRRSFIRELSKVNGFSGTCDGTKAAYRLCDYIFDRNLLNLYSWTGMSKSGAKECFNQHANFIDVFGEIIMMADNRYSKANNDKFFKERVLKYSETRSKRKKPHV